MSHRIRLRGPWTVIPNRDDLPAGRMTIPGTLHDGGFEGYVGRVQFTRTFHKPTNLEKNEEVWIVFEGVVGSAEAHLNGELLGPIEAQARFCANERLTKVNQLSVVVDATNDCCGIVGDVSIEIVSSRPLTSPTSRSSQ